MGALLPRRCGQIAAKGLQWAYLRQVKPEAPQAVLGHAASLQGLVAPPHLPPDPPHWPYLPTNLFVAGFRVGLAGTRNCLQAVSKRFCAERYALARNHEWHGLAERLVSARWPAAEGHRKCCRNLREQAGQPAARQHATSVMLAIQD